MGIFDASQSPASVASTASTVGEVVRVPGLYTALGNDLLALEARAQKVRSPADDGIRATPGDDETAPNATTAARLNRVVCIATANVGYSKAAKDTEVRPVALSYDAEVTEGPKGYAMTLKMSLTYASAFPEEGMVVWLKKKQQMINDDRTAELLLIETVFEDWVNGRWVPINTDIRYAEEAEAVVQAVITSDSGQTAGRVKTEGTVEDAKLGPVGERGRIVLTYYCDELYSYAEMGAEVTTYPRALVPLGFQLPWAPCDSPAAGCTVQVTVRGPHGTTLLSPSQNVLAFRDLQTSIEASTPGTLVVIPEPVSSMESESLWRLSRETLPPAPMMALTWLSIPDAEDLGSWEDLSNSLGSAPQGSVQILEPTAEDAALLRVALPGGQTGSLVRCLVETAAPSRDPDIVRVHTDIVITDCSGSTGMRWASSTVRSGFSQHEERRVLARLMAVPALVTNGLLAAHDVWRTVVLGFDDRVTATFEVQTAVAELDAATVQTLSSALQGNAGDQQALRTAGKGALFDKWNQLLTGLRGLRPGGCTSFTAGANGAKTDYLQTRSRFSFPGKRVEFTAYVNFDTDGGNNCGPCYDAVKALIKDTDVVQGHVLGVGAWVDQDCATKVAKILKGKVNLAVNFPEQAAADDMLRQDLSRWIKVIRTCPVALTVSAGSAGWAARIGQRNENGVECIMASGQDGIKFGAPDITDIEFTKAQLQGLQAGESVLLYLVSRVPLSALASRLAVQVNGKTLLPARATAESLRGVALGYHWLSALGGSPLGLIENKPMLCRRFRERMEDDLSFAWNLPTKGGSTAALGRARTEHRPPVLSDQQPEEPELREEPEPVPMAESMFFGASTWGTPRCAPPPRAFCTGPAACGSSGFGSAPRTSNFAAPQSTSFGGGHFGATATPMGFGAVAASLPASLPCRLASPAKAECKQRKKVSPGFGARKEMECLGDALMDLDSSSLSGRTGSSGPSGPSALLRSHRCMAFGPVVAQPSPFTRSAATGWRPDLPRSAATDWRPDLPRALNALKHIANSHMASTSQPRVQEKEDDMVTQIFGPPPTSGVTGGYFHNMYVCDGCGCQGIGGPRFRATNEPDFDLCSACRITGNRKTGKGLVRIPDALQALRTSIGALLDWWFVAFPDKPRPVTLGGNGVAARSAELPVLLAFAQELIL